MSDIFRYLKFSPWLRLYLLCVLTGVLAGLGALLFDSGLELLQRMVLVGWLFGFGPGTLAWPLLVVPLIGGALAGGLALWLAPEASGHGTGAVIRAFHQDRGRIRARVPLVKALCSILTIGSGGSAGKEGPIAQIGAGVGSTVGKFFSLQVPDRRILMLAGVAGGIGAIFKAPLGGALFAAEVLYREPDFEHHSVIPGIISSVTAYSVFTAVFGHARILQFTNPLTKQPFTPLFPSGEYMLVELGHYAVLGLCCSAVAWLFVYSMRVFERRIFKPLPLPLPRITKPALGGLLLGALALLLMNLVSWVSVPPGLTLGTSHPEHIMSGGHSYLQTVVDGALDPASYDFWTSLKVAGFLGLVALAKIAATGLTLGSGGSGGLLFPALFLGGITGATYAKLVRAVAALGWTPEAIAMAPSERAGMILVGMGGVFAACTKTPIASLVMVSEITGSYGLVVPLMLTCATAYLLSRSFTLNEEQVEGIADSPAHRGEFLLNVLEEMKVSEALPKGGDLELIPEEYPYEKIVQRIRQGTATVFPVVDKQGRLTGVFSINDLRQIVNDEIVSRLLVARDLASPDFAVVNPSDSLDTALRTLIQKNLEALVVWDAAASEPREGGPEGPARKGRVVGVLLRRDIVAAYHHRLQALKLGDESQTVPTLQQRSSEVGG